MGERALRKAHAFPAQPSNLDRLPGHCSNLLKATGERCCNTLQWQWLSTQRPEWKELSLARSSAPLLQRQCFIFHLPAATSLQLREDLFKANLKPTPKPQFGRSKLLFSCSQGRGLTCKHTQTTTTTTLNDFHAEQGISSTHHKGMSMLLTTQTDIYSSSSIFLLSHALLHSYGSVISENLQKITLAQTSNDPRPTQTDKFIRSFFLSLFGKCM